MPACSDWQPERVPGGSLATGNRLVHDVDQPVLGWKAWPRRLPDQPSCTRSSTGSWVGRQEPSFTTPGRATSAR